MSLQYEMKLASTQETRGEAEVAIKPHAARQREQVFGCIVAHGPVTDEQIVELTGLPGNTARPRRLELERAGRIKQEGVGRTRSGRRAIAWGAS